MTSGGSGAGGAGGGVCAIDLPVNKTATANIPQAFAHRDAIVKEY
jgi:hypothetical protein